MLVGLLDSTPEGPPTGLSDADTIEWLQKARPDDHPYLLPRPGPSSTRPSFAYTPTDDLKEDVEACEARIRERGLYTGPSSAAIIREDRDRR